MFLLPASVVIGLPPYASFRLGDLVLSIRTIGGASALLIAALLLICAVSLWSRPQYRVAAGVTALLVSLIALVSSNLGGFLVGTVLGLIGGALALSWTPPAAGERDRDQEDGPGSSRTRAIGITALFVGALVVVPAASPSASTTAAPSGRVWVLTASVLRLTGLQYHGVGTTRVGGATVEVLKFTASRIDITSLVQVSELIDGHLGKITAPPGSVSTATGHPIELLTLRLKGTLSLLGLIGLPVDFTPARPPPLVLPSLTFTDVTVVNTDLKHARLAIPDAKITVT
ncbi:hypothetical protein BS329_37660 [Amycolatopsis coloradensis]|uniref:Uncharacterized protein n=2 Tax=Amycolatopsis coloradensis TaxID=76021 RepID=A0A1R0KFM6_9PSEU|nr:hypothetical protein BS329_37660 [Amycolatopsis coloradensis]